MATKKALRLPEPIKLEYQPFLLDEPGWWLVLGDTHLPYHDVRTIELAIATAKKHRAVGVLLNGDIADCHELSTFDRDPTMPRYVEERQAVIAFLAYLRDRLPKARIIYKKGNHEERLDRYLMRHAPALFGLEALGMPALFQLREHGVEYVGERRVVNLGKLAVVHGHEFRPQVATPVNPARGVFLRARQSVLTSHWHQTSEHNAPNISGKLQAAWSIGCACQLNPPYNPLNSWNHGWAMVELGQDGGFSVRNLRVVNGEVV